MKSKKIEFLNKFIDHIPVKVNKRIKRDIVESILDSYNMFVVDCIKTSGLVVRNFGKFFAQEYKLPDRIDPFTKQQLYAKISKRVKFKPCKQLKDEVNEV